MAADAAVKVGVIGYGGIGRFHLKGWLALRGQGVNIVGVCDADPSKWSVVEEVYSEAGVPAPQREGFLYTDCSDFIKRSGATAVSVALPNFLHEPVGVSCFDAGLDVLLEKPAANTLDGAKNIVAACKRSGRLGMAQLNNNYTPTYELAEDIVRSGELGDLQTADGWWTRRNGIPFYGQWFGIKEKSGGGPGIDLAPHVLGWLLGIMRWPQPKWVSARTFDKAEAECPGYGPYGGGKFDPNGRFDVERRIQLYSQLDNGVTLNVNAAWAMHTDVERMGARLVGSKGTLVVERVWPINDGDDAKAVDSIRFFSTKTRAGKPWTLDTEFNSDSDPSTRDPFMGRTKTQPEMLECLRTGRAPRTSLDHLLTIQEIVDAAYASAADNGEPVRL
jgi:predicted dehydrogenase